DARRRSRFSLRTRICSGVSSAGAAEGSWGVGAETVASKAVTRPILPTSALPSPLEDAPRDSAARTRERVSRAISSGDRYLAGKGVGSGAEVERQVEDGGAVRQGADAHVVDARRRDARRTLEREVARRLE